MAASLLKKPADWAGMTYMEVVWMLYKAIEERCYVCAGDQFIFHYDDIQRLDMFIVLKALCYNIKRILWEDVAGNPTAGFVNPAKDPSLVTMATTTQMHETVWTLTDLIADIGDPEFYDFAANGRLGAPSPLENMTEGFKLGENNPPYLVQYYEIATRLSKPIIRFRIRQTNNPWQEYPIVTQTSLVSREATTQLQGINNTRYGWQDTTGLNASGISVSGRIEEVRWDAAANTGAHNTEWSGAYKATVLDGANVDDVPNICRSRAESFGFREEDTGGFGVGDNMIVDHFKSAQDIELNRLVFTLDYQNFTVGNLGNVNGRPQNVSLFVSVTDYRSGSDGPIAAGISLDNTGISTWTGQTVNVGGYSVVPAAPDHPVDLQPATPYNSWVIGGDPVNPGTCYGEEHGWQYEWRDHAITEEWDYEGGYDYYTTV